MLTVRTMSTFTSLSLLITSAYAQTTTQLTSSSTSTTSTTDAYPILNVADNLYGPMEFTTLDWILSLIILSILLGICLFCYCCFKYKMTGHKPSSPRGIVPSSNGDGYRPTVSQTAAFGAAHQSPKSSLQNRMAFQSALAGVAMTKRESARKISGFYIFRDFNISFFYIFIFFEFL